MGLKREERLEKLWQIGPMMVAGTPHGAELGMKFISIDIGRATLSLPYNKELIGNPDTAVLHGGAVTTLLDQACGLAAIIWPILPCETMAVDRAPVAASANKSCTSRARTSLPLTL